MATMAVIFLILSVVPALFPRWRDTLIASGILYAVVLAMFYWSLRLLDTMTSGEGPAFFAVMFYFGLIQILMGASFIAKLITLLIAKRIYVSARQKLLKYFASIFFVPVVLALIFHVKGFAARDLVVIACVLFSPFLWVSLAICLLPNNSFKPTPQIGSA